MNQSRINSDGPRHINLNKNVSLDVASNVKIRLEGPNRFLDQEAQLGRSKL